MVGSAELLPVTQAVEFDTALIRKLSQLGPRYTSYPTADRFNAEFGYRDYLQAVTGATARGNMHPLSLYIHIPFCESICYYCCLLYTSPSPRDKRQSRMPSSA